MGKKLSLFYRRIHLAGHSHPVYLFFDQSRVHVGNLSNGKFSNHLSRDDSFCTRVREGPLNAMDGDSGVAPHVGQQVHLQETNHDSHVCCCASLP